MAPAFEGRLANPYPSMWWQPSQSTDESCSRMVGDSVKGRPLSVTRRDGIVENESGTPKCAMGSTSLRCPRPYDEQTRSNAPHAQTMYDTPSTRPTNDTDSSRNDDGVKSSVQNATLFVQKDSPANPSQRPTNVTDSTAPELSNSTMVVICVAPE